MSELKQLSCLKHKEHNLPVFELHLNGLFYSIPEFGLIKYFQL